MLDFEIGNSAISRRVVRAVCDLAHRPLAGLRVLDLACAHGHYSFEMAKLGAQVLGIEGRESWLEQARRTKQDTSLPNVEFVQDDVRNLSKEKYGEFDIVLCLGILYHLDAPDVFEFVNSVFEVCRDFAIIETHFAMTPTLMHEWRGKRYWGISTFEHAVGATPEEKLKNVGASLDNERSFWFTQASLCNILQHVGFTSVYDCRIPMANLYVGAEWEFKIWGNRITLAAIKGQPLNLHRGPGTPAELETDWPENVEDYLFERYLYTQQAQPAAPAAALHAALQQVRSTAWVNPHLPIAWPTWPKGFWPKVVAFVQKVTRRLLRWYINPIIEQQNRFNSAVVAALNQMGTEISRLQEELPELQARGQEDID